ncbi:hypothetical protein CP973_19665 [Streptomyces albofaciens JCM 4342]|uniref:hypothetical protein n=1 Tax=Streptomyces albofaciens TaxID=66866 RepID=UPI00123AFBAF|nr:hypothetical protein [Streptomyces albofaciens]KAA6223842.1 hypothetical protein CP973_19665 [Streptomyces albofaciens JCM 4342]
MHGNGEGNGTASRRAGGRFARRVATVGAAALLAGVTGGAGVAAAQPAGHQAASVAKPQRSTHVTLNNQTGANWTRTWATLQHGEWQANSYPAESIGAYSSASWQSQSDGFATGTEGEAVYATGYGEVRVKWNNPYVGSNSYSCTAPGGHSCVWSGGSGNNASVTFTVR